MATTPGRKGERPVFIFILYAVMVWWGAYHWRRHALGFLVVLAGAAVLAGTAWFHQWMGDRTRGQIYVPVVQSILYPYIVLVVVVGLCFAFAPAHTGGRAVRVSGRCRGCGYDLRGLDPEHGVCPECGTRFIGKPRRRCVHCRHDLSGTAPGLRNCPGCGKHPRIRKSGPPVEVSPNRPRASGPVMSFRPFSAEEEANGAADRPGGGSASDQADADAQQQHDQRERAEQHPPHGR